MDAWSGTYILFTRTIYRKVNSRARDCLRRLAGGENLSLLSRDWQCRPLVLSLLPGGAIAFLPGRTVGRILLPLWKEWLRGKEALSSIGVAVVLGYVLLFHILPNGSVRALMLVAATILLMPTLFIFSTWVKSIDQFIGDLSYPIYISHVFVITAVFRVLTRMRIMSPGLILSARLLMVLVVAYLLKVLVADRVEVLRQGSRSQERRTRYSPLLCNGARHSLQFTRQILLAPVVTIRQ